jgi:hypothetical protein
MNAVAVLETVFCGLIEGTDTWKVYAQMGKIFSEISHGNCAGSVCIRIGTFTD